MDNQIVYPATGYLVNIVYERLEECMYGVEVNINYLTSYQVLILEITRWSDDFSFTIKRSLYVEYWSDALHIAEHIKRICFNDYKNTEESGLTEWIDEIIIAQTQK